ncbi:MAG: DNA alkylation repair protein [Candidatus Edwardsbacteria bacterium]|nr:DNA alkylation repair protein [Candidatus Edwardsbacteria bacterium]
MFFVYIRACARACTLARRSASAHKHAVVQKGYGWLLKEATRKFPKQVLKYVLKHKADMPRTALRYAIEKMPETWKKRAMAK